MTHAWNDDCCDCLLLLMLLLVVGQVVSCSQFEAHAGRGARRAPYDFIFTEDGLSLRRLAERLPAVDVEVAAPLVARKVRDVGTRHRHKKAHTHIYT
jgi:hypothetical protein